jgi:hypothetical protein
MFRKKKDKLNPDERRENGLRPMLLELIEHNLKHDEQKQT